jgi:hypothetical protein
MPRSPERSKKPFLGLTGPQLGILLGILAVLVILLCLVVIAFGKMMFTPTAPLPSLIPTLPDPTSIPPTATPTFTLTPSPTDTPTFTPTDTATATSIPEPTIVPTKGVPEPPDTTDNIHVAQIFNGHSSIGDEKGKVDLVWGSSDPTQPEGVFNLYYYPFDRDKGGGIGETHHDITWFLANHPDWIEYTCNKKTVAYEYGDSNVPLDITNPAVIDYMMRTYIFPAIQSGYSGIAFDNVDLGNIFGRCGIWRNGVWVKQTNYVSDLFNWASYMYKALHALNVSVAMNFPFDFGSSGESYRMYQYLDIAVDERGFTNWGKSQGHYLPLSEWLTNMQAYQFLDANGKGFVSINEMPEHFSMVSQAEKQWALANYLLVKGQYSYIAISGIQEYGQTLITPEYSVAIGHALGPMYQSQGVYMRDFSNGLAIVNPSSSKQTFNIILPSGVYQDLYGNYPNLLALGPQSGIVLLGRTVHTSDLFSTPGNAFPGFSLSQFFHIP